MSFGALRLSTLNFNNTVKNCRCWDTHYFLLTLKICVTVIVFCRNGQNQKKKKEEKSKNLKFIRYLNGNLFIDRLETYENSDTTENYFRKTAVIVGIYTVSTRKTIKHVDDRYEHYLNRLKIIRRAINIAIKRT